MRRVLAVIGFSSFFVTLFCIKFGSSFALIICSLAVLSLLLVVFIKKIRYWILILLFATTILSSINFVVTDNKINKYKEIYCHDSVEVSGVLLDYPQVNDSGFLYTFKTVDKNKVKFTLMTSDEILYLEPGDIIKGRFDFSDSYSDYTEKIYFSTYVFSNESLTVIPQYDKFNIAKFRQKLKQGIVDNTTVARGITKAIIFSDKSGISDKEYEDLLRCGLLHSTATSGLHLTIVTGFVFAFLYFLGFSKKQSSVVAIIFVVLFMIVIGFKFSLMRAGIMMLFYLSANLFDREGDGINSLGAVFIVLISQNLYCVTSCSLLLSTSAMLGMTVLFHPLLEKIRGIEFGRFEFLKRTMVSVTGAGLQSLVAILFTLPVTYIFFGYFSVIGILANAILSPFISMILILGVLICIVSAVPYLSDIIGGALDLISYYFLKIASFISDFKNCFININYEYVAWLFFIVACVIAVSVIVYNFLGTNKRKTIKITTIICVNFLLATVLLINVFPETDANIKMQNSGENICITVVSENKTMVIDTGGKNAVRKIKSNIVSKNSKDISFAIFPYASADSLSTIQNINNSFTVDCIVCDTSVMGDIKNPVTDNMVNIRDISKIKFGKIDVCIINQEFSKVLYLTNGKVSVLIIDRLTDCSKLPDEFKKCNTLVVKDRIPSDVDVIAADNAIICSYDDYKVEELANKFKTYSLIEQSIEFKMKNKLIAKKV